MKYYSGIIKVAALVMLLPIVLGKCTFSKTFQLYGDYRQIQSMEAQLANTPTGGSTAVPVPLHDENLVSNGRLVELLGKACEENSVSVKQYEPRLLDKEEDYMLYSANLVLSGNYIDLVKTLQYCEANIQSIKISTLTFEYDEKKMKDKKVEMILVLKQVESN